MKFAINYSPQADQLRKDRTIQVDIFKCPSWDDLVPPIQQSHSAYVHFSFLAGPNKLQEIDLDWVDNWLQTTDTLWINTHLAVSAEDFVDGEKVTVEGVIERAIRDVETLGKRFGNDRVIVENIPYPDPGWNDGLLKESVDPAVITEIVERSGCGLLLDVAHAIRTCEGLGNINIYDYLNALPVHALRELHVVGLLAAVDHDGVRQDHYELLPPDWEMVEWSVAQIRDGNWHTPDMMAFEYGGVGPMFEQRSKIEVIAEQVPRLYALAQSVS